MSKRRARFSHGGIDNTKLMEESREAYRMSLDNLSKLDRKRKRPSASFIALYDGGECPRCFVRISKGERVRHDKDGLLTHYTHKHSEITYDICQKCFLAKPCECDD